MAGGMACQRALIHEVTAVFSSRVGRPSRPKTGIWAAWKTRSQRIRTSTATGRSDRSMVSAIGSEPASKTNSGTP
jgi:hypothetical protein